VEDFPYELESLLPLLREMNLSRTGIECFLAAVSGRMFVQRRDTTAMTCSCFLFRWAALRRRLRKKHNPSALPKAHQ
jgi:hypothetical protein